MEAGNTYNIVKTWHSPAQLQIWIQTLWTVLGAEATIRCCRKAPKLRIAPHATGLIGLGDLRFRNLFEPVCSWRFPIQIVEFSDNLIIWDGNYMYIACPLESLDVKVLAAMGTTWKGFCKAPFLSLRQQNQCHKHLETPSAINLAWLLILGLIIGFTLW